MLDGVDAVQDLLAELCPPGKARLFGAPLARLEHQLAAGADLALILEAIRACAPGDGAVVRWGAAERAVRRGRVAKLQPAAIGRAYRPLEVVTEEDDPDPDGAAAARALARAALDPQRRASVVGD